MFQQGPCGKLPLRVRGEYSTCEAPPIFKTWTHAGAQKISIPSPKTFIMHTAAAATDNRNAKANKVYFLKKEIEKAKGGWGTGVFSGL